MAIIHCIKCNANGCVSWTSQLQISHGHAGLHLKMALDLVKEYSYLGNL